MNDADIIKALECCSNAEDILVKGQTYKAEPLSNLFKDALDLINRQKAEIERLHNILLSFTNEVHTWSNRMGYDTTGLSLIPILNEAESVREAIRTEAITEFEQRLTIHFGTYTDKDYLRVIDMVRLINQIAKEMKEGVKNA